MSAEQTSDGQLNEASLLALEAQVVYRAAIEAHTVAQIIKLYSPNGEPVSHDDLQAFYDYKSSQVAEVLEHGWLEEK